MGRLVRKIMERSVFANFTYSSRWHFYHRIL